MVFNNKIPPRQWIGDPAIRLSYDETIAMLLAKKNLEVPDYCNHDPEL